MSSRSKISESIQKQVHQRAKYLCEYCHASEQWQYVQFTVDHIMPLSLGGTDNLENLALACFHCNRRKTNRLTATDLQSGEEVLLFNPRADRNLQKSQAVLYRKCVYIVEVCDKTAKKCKNHIYLHIHQNSC
ncbi:HNH endonuclease [Nostoc sp.]|uniref:HNH endonuclease n=1 Tax=Nostoc sp. TaxID=1180 RepID=UPI00268486A8